MSVLINMKMPDNCGECRMPMEWCNKWIGVDDGKRSDDCPLVPADDVEEVVHCADCVHAEESFVSGCVYCNELERARIKEGFCSWGERKADV